eukprot:11385499-Karenia_brevis.AAC.1
MEKFTGDMSSYRMWMFNFTVALGQVDNKSSDEVRKLINRDDLSILPDTWDPSKDSGLDEEVY